MLEEKVEAFLKRHSISVNKKKVIVGVSGGPDSLSLLHFFWRKREQWDLTIVAVHVDHMFRGEESYLEAVFVKKFCAELKIDYEWKQIDVNDYLQKTGKSAQVGARDCRYQFFAEMMEKHAGDFLALGHHGDDQIETILMRMTRGSSGKARAGIPFKRPFVNGEIIRPLLAVNREEIESYCKTFHLNPRRDPSNEKPYYSRNRFRLEVVPFFKNENPLVHEHFQRMSEELYQDELFLEELTAEKMNRVMKSRNDEGITLNINSFLAMPLPLQRRGIQLILNYLYKVRPNDLSAIHIDLIISLLKSTHPSGKIDFPNGLKIIRSYQDCHFMFNQPKVTSYQYELEEPGEIELPNGGIISLEYINSLENHLGLDTIVLNPQKTLFPIIVRSRRNGDRIYPKGMTGTKKIKDIFIEKKIPLTARNEWPIVTDGAGTIIWLPELKHSTHVASFEALERYLLLTYKMH